MRLRLKRGRQRELLVKAVKAIGSERRLAKKLGLSKGAIYGLKTEKNTISYDILMKIYSYLECDLISHESIEEILNDNWGKKKGGKNFVENKRKFGNFNESMKKLHKASSFWMKEWHKNAKINDPENYYKSQYKQPRPKGRGILRTKNMRKRDATEVVYSENLWRPKSPQPKGRGFKFSL